MIVGGGGWGLLFGGGGGGAARGGGGGGELGVMVSLFRSVPCQEGGGGGVWLPRSVPFQTAYRETE